jgi:hypothetical protein
MATTLVLAAAGWLCPAPATAQAEIGKFHVVKRGDARALALPVTGTGSVGWALLEVRNPDGTRRCEAVKKLEPRVTYQFECPIEDTEPGRTYPARVRVFSDAKLNNRVSFDEPALLLTAEAFAAADAAGASPAGKATPVADGVDEGAPSPALPATFESTWYRRLARGFSMRAYENSGDLTLGPDELVFTAGKKKTVRIPYARITAITWDPVGGDLANHWVVVRFTNEAGEDDGVAFRDGARMGWRADHGIVYLAARRAAGK